MDRQKKAGLQALGCMGGTILLYGVLTLTASPQGPVTTEGMIARGAYGQPEEIYELTVEGLAEDAVPLTVTVGAKKYTTKEAEAVFEQIMEGMEARILGANPSLLEVRTDLKLPSLLEEYGVRLRWYPQNPERMDQKGTILSLPSPQQGEQEEWMTLGVRLSDGTCQQDYELSVRLLAPEWSPVETLLEGLKQEILKREEGQQTEDTLLLPMVYEGKSLHYRAKETSGYTVLLVLGFILAVLCYAKAQTEVREMAKKRERELLLDYAELVSKLMVYTGAGMTVRLAWERMVRDYEAAVQAGRQKTRAAYEEMRQACYQMQSGVSEGKALQEFGRSCRLQPYLKLSSLLEQNRKTGTKNLRTVLQMEVNDAWEQRKNLARKLGEEAGTKLLLPLFLMLGIVMVMIMVPAMMTMG